MVYETGSSGPPLRLEKTRLEWSISVIEFLKVSSFRFSASTAAHLVHQFLNDVLLVYTTAENLGA